MRKSSLKNTMSRSNIRVLSLGIAACFATAIAAGTATYAWFDVGGKSVADLQVNLSSQGFDLDIGYKVEGGEILYSDTLTKDDMVNGINCTGAKDPLSDVSGMYQSKWLNESFDYKNGTPKIYSLATDNSIDVGFFQFELFFKSESPALLFLDDNCSLEPNAEANNRIATLMNKDEDKFPGGKVEGRDLDQAVYGVRMSFLSEKVTTKTGNFVGGFNLIDPKKNQDVTYFGGLLETDVDGHYDYDESTKRERVFGEYTGTPIWESELNPTEIPVGEGNQTCFNSGHAAGVYLFDPEASAANGFAFAKESTNSMEYHTLHKNEGQYREENRHALAYLPSGVPTRVVFTMYIEGWDLDTTNYISSAVFDLNLGFTALDADPYV